MKAKEPRKKIRPEVETAVLAKSARRCTLCFHLQDDLNEQLGQIAHLDRDRTNGAEDNLAWMCLEHHSLYDSKTKQHKNYTLREVKSARGKLYDLVAEGKHLTPAVVQPYPQAEADKKILRSFLETVPLQFRINKFTVRAVTVVCGNSYFYHRHPRLAGCPGRLGGYQPGALRQRREGTPRVNGHRL